MQLFESLDALLLFALLLLIVARKLAVPYPTLLAGAGVGFAAVPAVPTIAVEPHLALALFIAPALLHAAYGTSPRGLKRHWFPLVSLAVFAVLLTAAAVAYVGVAYAGLPIAAAIALGAIVAPPDAASVEAVLSEMSLPRRGMLVLQGESLLNDATSLLLLGAAVAIATNEGDGGTAWQLALAAPGGVAFGLAVAWGYLRIIPLFAGSLGSSLVDFAVTFAIWLLAERLHLSPVLAVVTFGMIVAQRRPIDQPARDRLQTHAVWAAAVLVLNVVAFLIMGLQARQVLADLAPAERLPAIGFGLAVLGTVIVVRIVWVLLVRFGEGVLIRRFDPQWLPEPPSWRGAFIVSWSGMRGLLTLATAFALPADFPRRDVIVLAAFCVVLGTLLIQGLTLGPLIRRLGLDRDTDMAEDIGAARARLIESGLATIEGRDDPAAVALRTRFRSAGKVAAHHDDPQAPSTFDRLHLEMIAEQRRQLHRMRRTGEVAEDVYRRLQEELDWAELDARSFSDNMLRSG